LHVQVVGKVLFAKKDFKDLKYGVFSVEKNILGIKELRDYYVLISTQGNKDRSDLDCLVRYTMALYDKKSPLIKQLTNIGQRKNEAALVAGYDLIKDREVLEKLFDFTDPDLQLLAITFLKDQNDMYWSMIVSNEQTFYEYQKALISEVVSYKDDKQKMDALNVKSKLMDECDKITNRVESYYAKVFGDGEAQMKARQLKNFSPESIASRTKNV
jgi:hypothetical protein